MEKENFILELPLRIEKWKADILDKRFELLRQIYNYVQGKLLRNYRYLTQLKEYKECKTKIEKAEFFNTHPFVIKGISKPVIFAKMKSKHNLSDVYGITNFIEQIVKNKVADNTTYKDFGINTTNINAIANHIWAAWEKVIFGNGKRVSFKRVGELNTISVRRKNDLFTGLSIDLPKMLITFNVNGKLKAKAKTIDLKIDSRKLTEYEMYALKDGYDAIRVVTIIRKQIRGKYKYYVQFTIEGEKPQKGRELGKGRVGLDVGPSTLAASSNTQVTIDMIAENEESYKKFIKELWKISRQMDRSRRATNPDNYTEDGQIKRGKKLEWVMSKRYIKLNKKLKELYRKTSAIRKLLQTIKANELLSMGDTFIVEKNGISTWATKSKESKIKKDGKHSSRKRYGKSIGKHAPAQQLTILKNKVESLGGTFIEVDTKNAASQFDFTNGTFTKHERKERQIKLSNGNIHQRDLLAAFNLQHIDIESNENKEYKQYQIENMKRDYPTFCKLEQEEKLRHLNSNKHHTATIGW